MSAPHAPLCIEAIDPLRDTAWDQEAVRFQEASFFHSRAWARVLLETYGYRALYLRARDGDSTVGLLPLMEAKSVLTGIRGISLPFTDDCVTLAENPEVAGHLWREAHRRARQHGWKYLETRATPPPSDDGAAVPASVTYLNHRLALTTDAEEVFHRLHSSTRRAVRKAERSGLTAVIRHDEEAMREYYSLHCQTRKFHGLPPQSWSFFRNLQRYGLGDGSGAVVLALHEGRPVGGGVFFRFGQVSTYKFGASHRSFLHLRPNNLMMWTAIRHFCGQGAAVFDFGRTSVWNAGLRQYKLHWGTTERPLSYHRWCADTDAFAAKGDPASGWHVKVFQALPLWASRLAGELLYRHVA